MPQMSPMSWKIMSITLILGVITMSVNMSKTTEVGYTVHPVPAPCPKEMKWTW